MPSICFRFQRSLTCDIESGLIVFKLIEGEFAETGAYVDILMDDMAFPSYSSAKIKSRHMTFNEGRSMVLSIAVRF
jgi:Ca2+-dependent lipid-binding protein